ncbi:MAG: HNH endonuclease [Myxococcales bacterium]|nr:HNH endonuclease [Myxococcales bacterium]
MNETVASLNDAELLAAASELVRQACVVEAELLVHLGEIDHRKLYLERAHSSMFAFCTRELGFSEDAACNRILVARAARKMPAVIDAVRNRRVHLAGMRLLVPHLTEPNYMDLLDKAEGRTKEEIAEIVAALAPRPAPPTFVRKLPERPVPLSLPSVAPRGSSTPQRPVTPVAEDVFKLQLAISREFRDEIREAQDLMRHRVPDGDLVTIFRAALKVFVADVKKERFAIGRKRRNVPTAKLTVSRHVPDAVRRAVYERDGGRCTFIDDRGKRCDEKGRLELDHVEGFARTHRHDVESLRLLCRAHNQHAADLLYGRAFLDAARREARPP